MAIRLYIEDLALHTGPPTVNLEDNTFFIYVVESKKVTSRVKNIDIPVWFIREQFENGLFVPKYEKCSIMPAYMCTKTCLDPIIIQSNKHMTGFYLYPHSDTEHYQLTKLHEFVLT